MPTESSEHISNGPAWVTRTYLEDALRLFTEDKSLRIADLDTVPASAKGDNYLGVMSRIRVQYISDYCESVQTRHFILKSSFEDDANRVTGDAMDDYGFHYHEIEMYDKIFPQFKGLLKKIGFTEDCIPCTIKVDRDHKSILFEDLTARGYLMPDVKKGFNQEHAQMVLQKLAKMHAASVVLNDKNPGIFENCDRGVFNKHTDGLAPFFKNNVEFCGRMVRGWEGYEVYGEKILKLVPKFMEHGLRAMEPRNNFLNVLIHGDLWCNNTMFKYDNDGQPKDVILLDFQFSCWSSPSIDLHYFLNTSLMEDLRLNNIEEFVHFYYWNLRDTLADLGYSGKLPSLHEFWIQYMETSFFAVYSALVAQPVMTNECTEDASLSCLMEENTERSNKLRSAIYSNEKVLKNLRKLLPIFDRRGLLD